MVRIYKVKDRENREKLGVRNKMAGYPGEMSNFKNNNF